MISKIMKNLKLEYFETFILVSNKKGILEAAKELNLAQSTVSMRIAALEEAYGVKAFKRTQKGVELTEGGKIILETAKSLLDIYNDSLQKVNRMHDDQLQELHIGAPVVPGLYILPNYLEKYRDNASVKKIELKIEEMKSLIEKLKKDEYDIICLTKAKLNNDFIKQKCKKMVIGQDELVLAVPSDHELSDRSRVSLEDIRHYPFLSPQPYSELYMDVGRFLERGGYDYSDFNVVAHLDWPGTILTAIENGLGIGIICSLPVEKAMREGRKIKLLKISGVGDTTRKFYAVCNRGLCKRSPILKDFWDFLRSKPNT
jgi:DNA-binding transcriptional LysR family regulator